MQPDRDDRPSSWWIYRGKGDPHDGIDDLPEPPRGVGLAPHRFKEPRGVSVPLALDILCKFASETCRKQDIAILRPLALGNPELTRGEIDVREA